MTGPKSTTPDGRREDLPLWRQHFPIDTADDRSRSRREFIGGLAVAGGALACGQAALDSIESTDRESSEFQSHAPMSLKKKLTDMRDGEALLFHYPNRKSPCLLVKLADSEFVAYSQKCTHLACPVVPEPQSGQLLCPCHKGVFDLKTGAPLSGPPRSSLPRIRVEVAEDNTLTAIGVESTSHV